MSNRLNKINNRDALHRRCRIAAKDQKGWVVALDRDDLHKLLLERLSGDTTQQPAVLWTYLQERVDKSILSAGYPEGGSPKKKAKRN
jgi:hypothetical protein